MIVTYKGIGPELDRKILALARPHRHLLISDGYKYILGERAYRHITFRFPDPEGERAFAEAVLALDPRIEVAI
jgi:hypothetical protein